MINLLLWKARVWITNKQNITWRNTGLDGIAHDQSIISKQLRTDKFRGELSMKDKEKMPRMTKVRNISNYPLLFLQLVKVFHWQELREKIQKLRCYQHPALNKFVPRAFLLIYNTLFNREITKLDGSWHKNDVLSSGKKEQNIELRPKKRWAFVNISENSRYSKQYLDICRKT